MTNDERQTVIQALEAVDALIDHQFTGTSNGMTALQHACDDCREALGIMRREREQSKSDADSHAERQAISERNRVVVRLVQDGLFRNS